MSGSDRHLSVLHFADTDLSGGAAKAGYRIHSALAAAGHRSQMVVFAKHSEDEHVHPVEPYLNPWRSRLRRVRRRIPLLTAEPPAAAHVFHYDVEPDIRKSDLYRVDPADLDVVYLQHVRRLLTVRDIRSIYTHYRRPLVWMLHTMAPFTGGCNYTLGCDRYTARCGHCPQLHDNAERDLSREIWLRKDRDLRDLPLAFVAPSRDVARAAEQSSLISGRSVVFIPYPIETDVFQPSDRLLARKLLGLPAEARILATAAVSLQNWYKGTDLFVDVCHRLAAADDVAKDSLFVAVAGSGGRELIESLPLPGKALGRLSDDVAMALFYQAADVFVCSSRVETGPQTIPESLLCGTPVVSFGVGSALDLVNKTSGHLARNGDTTDMAFGIADVLGWSRREESKEKCRTAALGHAYERVAAEHTQLCVALLDEARSNATRHP